MRQPPPRVFSHFSTGLSNSQVSSKRWVVERFRGPTELRPWMAAGREAIYCKSTETQSSSDLRHSFLFVVLEFRV